MSEKFDDIIAGLVSKIAGLVSKAERASASLREYTDHALAFVEIQASKVPDSAGHVSLEIGNHGHRNIGPSRRAAQPFYYCLGERTIAPLVLLLRQLVSRGRREDDDTFLCRPQLVGELIHIGLRVGRLTSQYGARVTGVKKEYFRRLCCSVPSCP